MYRLIAIGYSMVYGIIGVGYSMVYGLMEEA
jgi:branched-subunit amino acid ABC-type transport system permease component